MSYKVSTVYTASATKLFVQTPTQIDYRERYQPKP